MRFLYQAAQETATTSRAQAQWLFNPESAPMGVKITPHISVQVNLSFTKEILTDQGIPIERKLGQLPAVETLVNKYIQADLLGYVNRALAELDAKAETMMVESKHHLESELQRIKDIENARQ